MWAARRADHTVSLAGAKLLIIQTMRQRRMLIQRRNFRCASLLWNRPWINQGGSGADQPAPSIPLISLRAGEEWNTVNPHKMSDGLEQIPFERRLTFFVFALLYCPHIGSCEVDTLNVLCIKIGVCRKMPVQRELGDHRGIRRSYLKSIQCRKWCRSYQTHNIFPICALQ